MTSREELDAIMDELEELNRARRLSRFDPPPCRETVDEIRARTARLRAQNDAIEVERIPLT